MGLANNTPESGAGISSAGRWCAIATELPCVVLSLMLVGQVIGSSVGGVQGGTTGALIGVIAGVIFGTYSVYLTVQHFEAVERAESVRRTYMPPLEEILEEPEFLRDYDPDERPHD
ncbi:MAG: hypothetical protein ACTSYL_11010 [Candidatus Thorarchaeota archaeon]